MPDHCPACGGEIVRLEGEAVHRCVNPYCPSRGLEGLRHFVSRGALDIDGVGEKLIARFWELGLVRRAPDLYALTAEQLAELDGFQQRSARERHRLDRARRGSARSAGCSSASASRTWAR